MRKRWIRELRRSSSEQSGLFGFKDSHLGYCIAPEHDLTDHHYTNLRLIRTVHDLSSRIDRFSANHIFAYTTFQNTYRKRSAFSYSYHKVRNRHRMASASGVFVFIALI
jgi:hypothetical protein